MKKVISVVGTRPELIKLAGLNPHLAKYFNHQILNTGQHYDYAMSRIFFEELRLPKANFNLGVGSASQARQVGQMLVLCERVFLEEKPNLVIVYGDTNTTLAGALAAAKLGIAVAHVEAGMRSYEKTLPEEINRVVVDHLADLFLCFSATAVDNLAREGISKNVYLTGDPVYDLLLKFKPSDRALADLKLLPNDYFLLTIHRQENTDDASRLMRILKVVDRLDKQAVWPVHPRAGKMLLESKIKLANIRRIKPVNFKQMLSLEAHALGIITDSGGVQKEAFWFKVPCFTLRSVTEWVETVNSGWNQLVLERIAFLPKIVKSFKKPKIHQNYYGDGRAGMMTVDIIRRYLA